MDNSLELNIGKRIKSLRKSHGLSMRDLAERSNLSANAISLIERGENSPTVSSLKRLSKALDVSIHELFEKKFENSVVHIKHSEGMYIKKENFEIESLGYGFPNQKIEPYHMIINPGVDTSSKVISHPGQEFVYCLSSEINYYIGGRQYKLSTGDSLLFNAQCPHGWCNPNTEKVELLLVFYSNNDANLAHQHHMRIGMEA